MAWADSLLDCKFRGVVFDVVGTRDSYGRAVSVAEVPYADGGVVEDLGGRPARLALQAVFFGADYEARLREALAAFRAAGTGELMHPVFGSIKAAQCVSCEVAHQAGEPDACSVALEFIESGEPKVFFEAAGALGVQSKVGGLGDTVLGGAVGRLAEVVSAVRAALPFAALTELRQSMLGPLLGLAAQTQGVSLSGLDVLDEPRAWASDLAALSNAVIGTASFGDNLLADWRAVTSVFSRVGASYGFGSTAAAPATSPAAWQPAATPTEAQAVATVRLCLHVQSATAQADVAAIVLAAEAELATLSPAEIEMVVNGARVEIEVAIAAARLTLVLEQSRPLVEALKDQALALQVAAQAIIEQRPPLVVRRIEGPGNLRLLAHRWYGDHSRATELLRLNNPRSPNALQMGDSLRAYAR